MTDPLDTINIGDLLEHGPDAPELPVPSAPGPMVKTSMKLPLELARALEEEADRDGIGRSTLIRQFIETGLAQRRSKQVLVSLAEVQAVVAALAQRKNPAA